MPVVLVHRCHCYCKAERRNARGHLLLVLDALQGHLARARVGYGFIQEVLEQLHDVLFVAVDDCVLGDLVYDVQADLLLPGLRVEYAADLLEGVVYFELVYRLLEHLLAAQTQEVDQVLDAGQQHVVRVLLGLHCVLDAGLELLGEDGGVVCDHVRGRLPEVEEC